MPLQDVLSFLPTFKIFGQSCGRTARRGRRRQPWTSVQRMQPGLRKAVVRLWPFTCREWWVIGGYLFDICKRGTLPGETMVPFLALTLVSDQAISF